MVSKNFFFINAHALLIVFCLNNQSVSATYNDNSVDLLNNLEKALISSVKSGEENFDIHAIKEKARISSVKSGEENINFASCIHAIEKCDFTTLQYLLTRHPELLKDPFRNQLTQAGEQCKNVDIRAFVLRNLGHEKR